MWSAVSDRFNGRRAQLRVARALYARGLAVNDEGRVHTSGVPVSHAGLARTIGVDRRVVDQTCRTILDDTILSAVFRNLRPQPALRDVASHLGLVALRISPDDAAKRGLLSRISTAIAEFDVGIHQAIAEDPSFNEEPYLLLVLDKELPDGLVKRLRRVEGVRSITIV